MTKRKEGCFERTTLSVGKSPTLSSNDQTLIKFKTRIPNNEDAEESHIGRNEPRSEIRSETTEEETNQQVWCNYEHYLVQTNPERCI